MYSQLLACLVIDVFVNVCITAIESIFVITGIGGRIYKDSI